MVRARFSESDDVMFCCRISVAQLNDSDNYICIAHNSLSRVLVGAQLTVQGMYSTMTN